MKSKVQSLMALAVLVGAGAGSSAFSPKHALAHTYQVSKVSGVFHYFVIGTVTSGLRCVTTGESCTISTNLTITRLNNANPGAGQTNYTTTFPTLAEANRLSAGSIFQ